MSIAAKDSYADSNRDGGNKEIVARHIRSAASKLALKMRRFQPIIPLKGNAMTEGQGLAQIASSLGLAPLKSSK